MAELGFAREELQKWRDLPPLNNSRARFCTSIIETPVLDANITGLFQIPGAFSSLALIGYQVIGKINMKLLNASIDPKSQKYLIIEGEKAEAMRDDVEATAKALAEIIETLRAEIDKNFEMYKRRLLPWWRQLFKRRPKE